MAATSALERLATHAAQENIKLDRDEARRRVAPVVQRLQPLAPKVAELLEGTEEDLLAFFAFPSSHWCKLRSTNPGSSASIARLDAALMSSGSSRNYERLVCRRYLGDESMRLILDAPAELSISLTNDDEQEKPAALAA